MTGRTALVTGASSGIGLELARLLAADDCDLIMVARNRTRLESIARELRSEHHVSVTVLAVDLAQPGAADRISGELDRLGLHVDVLVNNAGFSVYGRFDHTDAERELEMLNVNIITLTSLTKLLLPGMIERGTGSVLNVGSTGSFAPGPLSAAYCASKAYVLSFSEAIAEELRGTGVTVTALCPGPTATEFAKRARMTETRMFRGRLAPAATVAAIGYRAMRKGRRVVIPGFTNAMMTHSIRFSPRSVVAGISKRMLAAGVTS